RMLVCPDAPRMNPGYAFNAELSGRKERSVRAPQTVPMFFDSLLGVRNGSDRLESFARRHRTRGNVAFADGHVESLTTPPPATVRQIPNGDVTDRRSERAARSRQRSPAGEAER
ncbi:MAG TPA: H-X9-DG-CTERM domain-containing protein, partial [Armatimonadota bacterium]|nr:H-X9-DG-CTERM domain-containing protein [Armatimonadota bacterium]